MTATLRLLFLVCLVICCIFSTLNHVNAGSMADDDTDETKIIMEGLTLEDEESIELNKETFTFQAEVSRLMDIIINSLYKNREVFLRELISNASDALDKLRFLAVSNTDVLGTTREMEIKISYNEELKTLTVRDTGIGMTKADLVNNLGTLAKSGTKRFLDALGEGADMGLIGQFGVGFYSVYLVADKVRVVSKHNDDDQYIWESTADAAFTVSPDPRGNTLGRGTEITMFLKPDALEFIRQERLEEIVTRHSEFITFPISLHKKHQETREVVPEPKEDDGLGDTGLEVEEDNEPKTEKYDVWEWVPLNSNIAIWARDKDAITEEEYQKFYKVISKDTSDARTWIHFKAEGDVEFKSIMYVPSEAQNLYDEYNTRKAGMRLYVKRVLIQDDFEDLLPRYLNFIRGVVDSDDLPLNVSRETLQQHKILKVMAKKLVRKALEMLRKLATSDSDDPAIAALDQYDPEHPYMKFWEQFGKSIKMGVIEDAANRSKLAKLLRYKSTKSGDTYTSLDDYVANKPDWQKDIYYVAAESLEAARKLPFLEVARKKDIEVLLLYDPVDEYTIQNLGDFDGLKLQSLTKEGLKFGDEDEDVVKKRTKRYREMFKPLTKYLKDLFAGKVSKVTVSTRLEESPSVIVTSQYGHSANMERIVRSQTFSNPEAYKAMQAMKTLELNPRHPIVVKLNKLVQDAGDKQSTKDLAFLLYDTALLTSGFQHDEAEDFASRMYRTLAVNLNLKSLDLEEEIEVEVEEEQEEEEISLSDSASETSHDEF